MTPPAITVHVLYFAGARDAAGVPAERLDVQAATVGDVLDAICARHPALDGRRAALRLARNQEFARLDASVASGDEIAVIPPVAGG